MINGLLCALALSAPVERYNVISFHRFESCSGRSACTGAVIAPDAACFRYSVDRASGRRDSKAERLPPPKKVVSPTEPCVPETGIYLPMKGQCWRGRDVKGVFQQSNVAPESACSLLPRLPRVGDVTKLGRYGRGAREGGLLGPCMFVPWRLEPYTDMTKVPKMKRIPSQKCTDAGLTEGGFAMFGLVDGTCRQILEESPYVANPPKLDGYVLIGDAFPQGVCSP